ncbi:MAG: NAD(+)/NADH kinase [Acidimicrobiales bacterium]
MTTVVFVVHPDRPQAADLAKRAADWLLERGHHVEPVLSDAEHSHEDDDEGVFVGAPGAMRDAFAPGPVDLAVSLGGDGTMLRTVAMAAPREVPVLGVNLGQLGYLTEVEPAGLEGALGRFLEGDYRIEERMTLDVSLERAEGRHDGPTTDGEPQLVLNEAVVQKTHAGHTIRVAAQIAGRPFVTYAADGLLVATPTGSTAYNLSVRGPIVSPQLQAMVVTPVSPHMLFDRPLVLAPDEWLRLELASPRPALLVLDGQRVTKLEPGDAVVCRTGRDPARLVTFGPRDFHAILRARFNLADR